MKEETKQKLREHWKQFNTRGYEISRENYGLAARDNYQEERPTFKDRE